jgi:hypothetical protein
VALSGIAPTVTLAEKVTCVVCVLSGLVGFFLRPKAIALVICFLGVIVGVLWFLLIVFAEAFSPIFV